MNATNQVGFDLPTLKFYTLADGQTFWAMVQAIGVVFTLALILRQIRLQRIGNSISVLSDLEDEWKSSVMASARKEICENLIFRQEFGIQSAERVAGFFEKLGSYEKKKMFDSDLVWELYSYYTEHYWAILKPSITTLQKEDRTVYTNFSKFYERMRVISKRKRAPTDFKQEAALLDFASRELESK